MKNPKYFICPMSKLITDSVIEMDSDKFGLLATRRQIDWDGGYVNNWNTKEFYEYVRSKSRIVLERDHGGPMQGTSPDSGYTSFTHDVNYFDIIHIDPWKLYNGWWGHDAEATADAMNYLHFINPKVLYEIGTEEAINYITVTELSQVLEYIKDNVVDDVFYNIEYVVIQSGVGLDLVNMANIGNYDELRLIKMIEIVKSYGKKCKEHNGDYLSNAELELRFKFGVDSINIGPEIAQIQTLTYLEHMTDQQIDEFYEICLSSNKWKRWVDTEFDTTDKRKLIQVCGHYCFDQYALPNVDEQIKENIKKKLISLP